MSWIYTTMLKDRILMKRFINECFPTPHGVLVASQFKARSVDLVTKDGSHLGSLVRRHSNRWQFMPGMGVSISEQELLEISGFVFALNLKDVIEA